MPRNEIKAFAVAEEANVINQNEWENSQALKTGFKKGLARSSEINKAIRQSSSMAAAIAEFTAEKSGEDILDNGDITTLKNHFESALKNISSSCIGEAEGDSDTITAETEPAIKQLVHGQLVYIRAKEKNQTKNPTLKINRTETKTIVKGNNLNLEEGDIAGAGHWLELQYDAALDKWVLQNPAKGIISQQSGVPVGTIEYFACPEPPAGYLKADGGEAGRETYPDLFKVIGTTFGEGNGETTFNLPDLIDCFAQGSNIPGKKKESGLPNIQGETGWIISSGDEKTQGAFELINRSVNSARLIENNNSVSLYRLAFNASNSNPIYRTSDIVQPPALTLLPCIKAFDVATNPGLIDITGLANEVSGKADRNLSNVLPSGIDTCVRWGIPDYKRKVSLCESDFPYSVQKPGLFTLGTGGGNNDKVYVNDDLVFFTYVNEEYGMSNGCFVDSGDVLTISLSGAGGRNFNFYPFKGVK